MRNYPDKLRGYIALCAACAESLTEWELAQIDVKDPLDTEALRCAFCGATSEEFPYAVDFIAS